MREPPEIVELYRVMEAESPSWVNKAREVKKMYSGDMAVPLPELDKNEKPAAVNLLGPGLDQLAMRVASVLPDQSWPSLRDGIQRSADLARQRRKASLAWWEMNDMKLHMRLRARHLLGYGTSATTLAPVALSAFDKREIPHWRVRDPLDILTPPASDPLDFEPPYAIARLHLTAAWLRLRYPQAFTQLRKGAKKDDPTARFDVIEFHDEDHAGTLILIGEAASAPSHWSPGMEVGQRDGGHPWVVLEMVPNRAGIPLVVFPGRITLGDPHGLFDGMIGKYMRAAKLDALETIAVQRAIFADEWVVSHPNSPGTAKIIRAADGKTGIRGVIANGVIQTIQPQPGVQTPQAIDRIERTERIESFIPSDFGAEGATNVRTARRGDQLLGAAIDMPVQEAQEILAVSLEAEGRRAVALMKAYYGQKKTSFYVGRDGKTLDGADSYVPDQVFETDVHTVAYPMPGADMNGMVIAAGQRIGLGTLSTETFMEIDPMVKDAQLERSRVAQDGMRKALLASVEQGAATGSMSPDVVARILHEMSDPNVLLEDAITVVHEEMQKAQAAQQMTAQQGQPPGPESQPGMGQLAPAQPGTPPGQGPGPGMPVGPANPNTEDLANILSALRKPAAQSPPEMAQAGANQ